MNNNSRFNSHRLIDNRQIRVFLSSTFSDMQVERTALVKTFEKLKVEANRRNVNLSLIDLRWGVTDEEARSGKVISVCLNEIEHSHPFFIGLLGNRYGTSPEASELEKNPELKERYPWIEQDIYNGLSITEMEMQYGVLRNEAEVDAVFFIKNSDLSDDNPRLTALKTEIGEQKRYPVEDYFAVYELCEKVEKKVTQIINKYYPVIEATAHERQRNLQRAFINSRHAHYIERQSYYDIIDNFIHSDDNHLVFTGESGMGKSALLANWIKRNQDSSDFNLIYYFVGNSFAESNYENILRYLCDEIVNCYSFEEDDGRHETMEEEAQRLVNMVALWEQPLVIIIDGINQIVTTSNEKLLLWLPDANKKVKYIFSTLQEDDTMCTFKNRGYRVEVVMPLKDDERKRFIENYLSNVGKRLDDCQLQRIMGGSENENTLVLKTLLDELICFGAHNKLNKRINYYLSSLSYTSFFDRVLQRMEEDYSVGEDIVRHALTLIAVSENGLSEDELLSILACRRMDWQLFFCSFFNHFVIRNGLVTFSHRYIVDAVNLRYHIDDVNTTFDCRSEIVSYFNSLQSGNRRNSELAFQYYELSDWDKLYIVILNFDTFKFYYNTNQYQLGLYWRALLGADDEKYTLEAYLRLPKSKSVEQVWTNNDIAIFVQYCIADYPVALKYYFSALRMYKKIVSQSDSEIATFYNNIGNVYDSQGDFSNALKYYFKDLEINEKTYGKHHPNIATSYNNIGEVYRLQGELKKALELHVKALRIEESVFGFEHPATAQSYNNISLVYYGLGDYVSALAFQEKCIRIEEKILGEKHPTTAVSYLNIGSVYDAKGDQSCAFDYYIKSLAIFIMVLGEVHPYSADCYNNIGEVYRNQEDYSTALEFHLKALNIRVKIFGENNHYTAQSYNNIGLVYEGLDDFEAALDNYYKALEIWKDVFGEYHSETANCYNNIGMIYDRQKMSELALMYHHKALKIRKKVLVPRHPDIAGSYNNLGALFYELGDNKKAIWYLNRAVKIFNDSLGDSHPNTLAAKEWLELANSDNKTTMAN